LRKLFTTDQERLIEEFGHEVVAERWLLPDTSDLVELSIRVEPAQATTASQEFLGCLESLGLEVDGDMQTKTRGALTFFTSGEGFDDQAHDRSGHGRSRQMGEILVPRRE
jgi:hypothetical protein